MRSDIRGNLRMQSVRFVVALLGILLLGGSSYAQYTTASLGGTVSDPSGAAVPEARVTAQNIATGLTKRSSTGADGAYLLPELPVGMYKLTVEKSGFSTYVQDGITLVVNQAATVQVKLSVGAATQQITVMANAELVNTREARIGQLVGQKSIVDLPLNGRQAQTLVFLGPGTTDVTSHYCGVGCEGGVYPGEQYASVGGSQSIGINYQLDGIDHNDPYINSNLPFPNPDAIQEFNIQTDNMSAEYGNTSGAVVNVVSKSGTNTIHGDVFEFVRNGALNARNFFAPTHDTLKRNQFGGSVGGPIKKDKLFYFGTYQGTRNVAAAAGEIVFVPTRAERSGDFSDLCPGGFNASGICPSGNGKQLHDPITGTPFLNNHIPTSRLSPAAASLLQYIPLPNGPGRQLTFLGPELVQPDDQFMTKGDYYVGKHQLSGRYFFTNFKQPPKPQKTNLIALDPNATAIRIQNIAINDTYNVTPTLLLNTWFGLTRQIGGTLSDAPLGPPDFGIKTATLTPPELAINVGGAFSIQSGHVGVFNRGDQVFRENVTLLKGGHELRFGGGFTRIKTNLANRYNQSGVFNFRGGLSGDNIGDLMLGEMNNFKQFSGGYRNYTGHEWSLYFQDNWRVNERLHLELGLRWDPYSPISEANGIDVCFQPGQQSVRFPNAPLGALFGGTNHDPGCPRNESDPNLSNFGPRLGFAYRLTQDGKTSFRGGAGYYYQLENTVAIADVGGPPFVYKVNVFGVNFDDPYSSAGIANPYPQNFGLRLPGPEATFATPYVYNYVYPKDFRLPQIARWNLTLERQLGASWVLRMGYVGQKGTHLSGGDQEQGAIDVNPAIYIPGKSTVGNTQARRIYPQISAVGLLTPSFNSNYNALQLTVEKRLSKGLSLLGNYTWAKNLTDFGLTGIANTATNPFNRHFDYGRSEDDIPSVFKLSGTWQIPNAKVHGIAGGFLNGWELTSIVRWQGGFPFTVLSGVDNSFSGVGADRADFVGTNLHAAQLSSGRSHGEEVLKWFDTSLFVPNAIGTFGNAGKSILRGPRLFNTDMGLLKNTRIREHLSLQFRAEFFNIFNNVNFFNPNNVVTGDGFGRLTAAGDPRILQFALKLVF